MLTYSAQRVVHTIVVVESQSADTASLLSTRLSGICFGACADNLVVGVLAKGVSIASTVHF